MLITISNRAREQIERSRPGIARLRDITSAERDRTFTHELVRAASRGHRITRHVAAYIREVHEAGAELHPWETY